MAWTLDQWLSRSDSLSDLGQDAAALEAFANAERAFTESGDCAVALFADRRSRVPTWNNPVHADEALTAALQWGGACPELQGVRALWSLALGK